MIKTVEKVSRFVDVLMAGFDDLNAVDGDIDPPPSSGTTLAEPLDGRLGEHAARAGGVYHELSTNARRTASAQPLTRSELRSSSIEGRYVSRSTSTRRAVEIDGERLVRYGERSHRPTAPHHQHCAGAAGQKGAGHGVRPVRVP